MRSVAEMWTAAMTWHCTFILMGENMYLLAEYQLDDLVLFACNSTFSVSFPVGFTSLIRIDHLGASAEFGAR